MVHLCLSVLQSRVSVQVYDGMLLHINNHQLAHLVIELCGARCHYCGCLRGDLLLWSSSWCVAHDCVNSFAAQPPMYMVAAFDDDGAYAAPKWNMGLLRCSELDKGIAEERRGDCGSQIFCVLGNVMNTPGLTAQSLCRMNVIDIPTGGARRSQAGWKSWCHLSRCAKTPLPPKQGLPNRSLSLL